MPVSFVFREGFFWSGASELRLWFKKKKRMSSGWGTWFFGWCFEFLRDLVVIKEVLLKESFGAEGLAQWIGLCSTS